MGGKLLDCHATSKDFERKLGRRFSVDDAILENLTPTTTNSSITSEESESSVSLLSLPYEILSLIFDALPHAPSQIALALTCKQLAAVSQGIDLARSYTCPKYAGSLPKEVFDIPYLMKQLSSWVPEHLQLCDHCLTSRPTDPAYWADVAGIGNCGNREAMLWTTKNGWTFSNASWHKQTHNICPGCRATCTISDFSDCDGCRVLGRLGDVDWARVGDGGFRRREIEREIRAGSELNVEQEHVDMMESANNSEHAWIY